MRFADGYMLLGVDITDGGKDSSVAHIWSINGPVRLLAIETTPMDAPWFARVKVVCSPDVATTGPSKHEHRHRG